MLRVTDDSTHATGRRLQGRVALITGASRGLGAAAARRFVAEGAAVALAHEPSDRMAGLTRDLAAELEAAGGRTWVLAADLGDPTGPGRLVEQARERLGPLDILVANAADQRRAAIAEISVEDWDALQAVNVRGTFLLAQAAAPDLIASGHGSIITLTSVMAAVGFPLLATNYVTSKGAILSMTRALARELGPQGVRANAIMPGAIRTEAEAENSDAEQTAAVFLPLQSLKRRGVADDLAGAFAFLASDDSAFITGQVLCIDGGWVLR
jgi:3-oxoacyl-[acyl-carrier protein] reductase